MLLLKLKEITKNEKGQFQEIFKTDNKRFKQVKFIYVGTENSLDSFLTTLLTDYAKKHEIID